MTARSTLSHVAAFALLASACIPRTSARAQSTDSMLVSPSWLASRLTEPKLVVIHIVGQPKDYDGGHIPGARKVLFSQIAGEHNGLSVELHPVPQLDSVLEAAGVSNDSRIVIYGNPVAVGRLYMTLDYLGLAPRTSVLNGGLGGWKSDGHELSTEVPAVARGTITPHLRSVVVDAQYVNANLRAPKITILDARDPEFYNAAHAMDTMPRQGHVAGALNIPYTSVLNENGTFKSKDALAEMFKTAGVKPGSQVVTYCHIGMQGSLLYLAAKYIGYDARLYDGSYEDWRKRSELPIVTPSK
ncbi:MAG: sulfurtransferase [Gemmatimonadota bacterium]|nr:sulfurtransferase [Gemmatimonadota bacterium]